MKHFSTDDHHFNLLISLLMVLLGIVLLVWPGHVMTTALTVLGIALLAAGVIFIANWYRGRLQGVGIMRLLQGLALGAAGLLVLGAPKFHISIIPTVIGVIVLINGAMNLGQALDLRRSGYGNWGFSLALAIVTIILGAIMVLNPFSTMELLVAAIGGVILYNGLSNLWIESRYRSLFR